MPQDDQLGLTRRSRRVYGSGGDSDVRGWTLLHIGARKGDLKEELLKTDAASPLTSAFKFRGSEFRDVTRVKVIRVLACLANQIFAFL
ncbi:hypothetical protein ACSBR2_031484 [Camellia fascicularis]